MAGKQGNVLSVLRRADNTLLDKLAAGNRETNRLRDTQLGYLQEGLNELGETADSNTDLLLAKAQTPDEVRDVLDNQLGMFADKGAAAKSATARNLGLLTEESTKIGNLTKDLANRDVLETWNNKQTIKKELGELAQFTRGTPEYKQKAEEIHARNIATGTPDKAITDLYGQDFANANIQINPETIQNAIGVGVDLTNPDNFTTNAYNTAVKTISDRLQGQWTGIQDKSVFDAKAKDLLSKSEWGQNFDRQTKLEAGQTTQDIRLKGFANNLGTAVNTGDTAAVDRNINEMLTYARKNNITGEALAPFNEFINIALERTAVDPVALFKTINPESQFTKYSNDPKTGSTFITPNEAKKLENELKLEYRKKYPNLSDKYLLPKIQSDLKQDGNLAFSIQQGKDITKYKAELKAQTMKKGAVFKGNQEQVLFDMQSQGQKEYIVGQLTDKLDKYMDPTSNDRNKLMNQSSKLIDRFKGFFSDDQGNFLLKGKPAEEGFNLTLNRVILGNAGLRKDWLSPSDLVLGTLNANRDASKLSNQQLMKAFVEALPNSSGSIKSLKFGEGDVANITNSLNAMATLAKDAKAHADANKIDNFKTAITRAFDGTFDWNDSTARPTWFPVSEGQ
tara:strand:- start:231 stop:2096 length:1866 start_codon:yes stop_codon:yes gene_type:complete